MKSRLLDISLDIIITLLYKLFSCGQSSFKFKFFSFFNLKIFFFYISRKYFANKNGNFHILVLELQYIHVGRLKQHLQLPFTPPALFIPIGHVFVDDLLLFFPNQNALNLWAQYFIKTNERVSKVTICSNSLNGITLNKDICAVSEQVM